jgi:sigma-B regulation protein RsbU (phosphoserine phosphatase)
MTLKLLFRSALTLLLVFSLLACKKETTQTPEQTVEVSLDVFVSKLVFDPPTNVNISDRVKEYMLNSPTDFFGATVAMLDSSGVAINSPYWYRGASGLVEANLATDTSYHINDQLWLRQPIDNGISIWTAPYFDTGGGNIWMKTRSVPVVVNGRIIAVATTDLAL